MAYGGGGVVAVMAAAALAVAYGVEDDNWSSGFPYSVPQETVVELGNVEQYEPCDLTKAIRMYTDGSDMISLDEKCKNGLKLPINVLPPLMGPAYGPPSSSHHSTLINLSWLYNVLGWAQSPQTGPVYGPKSSIESPNSPDGPTSRFAPTNPNDVYDRKTKQLAHQSPLMGPVYGPESSMESPNLADGPTSRSEPTNPNEVYDSKTKQLTQSSLMGLVYGPISFIKSPNSADGPTSHSSSTNLDEVYNILGRRLPHENKQLAQSPLMGPIYEPVSSIESPNSDKGPTSHSAPTNLNDVYNIFGQSLPHETKQLAQSPLMGPVYRPESSTESSNSANGPTSSSGLANLDDAYNILGQSLPHETKQLAQSPLMGPIYGPVSSAESPNSANGPTSHSATVSHYEVHNFLGRRLPHETKHLAQSTVMGPINGPVSFKESLNSADGPTSHSAPVNLNTVNSVLGIGLLLMVIGY